MRLQAFRATSTSALSPVDPLYRNAGSKPTLDQRFAKDKSLVDKVSGQNLITFTRASSGTYVDSDGLIKTAANNEARFDHDPTTGESLGLLIEEGRTNLFLNSDTLSTQSVTSAATEYTLSFYGTGTVTLSGNATGTLVGTGVNERVSLVVTATAGTITATVTGTVEKGQVEEGSFPTSYIPTTNAQATRATDSVSIGSTNFSNFYNQSSGTFVTTSSSVTNLQSSIARGLFMVNEFGVSGNTFRHYMLYRNNGLDNFTIGSRFNDANAFSPNNIGDPTYNNDTIAYGYLSSEISKVFHDGSLITSSASILDWTTYTATQLNIGGPAKLNGHISRLTYFPTKRTDQELINVSGGDTAIPVITYGITSAGGTFNLRSTGTVDYAVDWDSSGGYQESTSNALVNTYTAGNYDLVVYSDDVYRPYLNNVTADATQITSVVIGSGADLGTNIAGAWFGASNMTSFVCAFDVTSGVTSFSNTWRLCNSLTSFPLIATSSGTAFINAWRACTSLTSFSANMFDTTGTLVANAFGGAWLNCALTAQSIENILVSLDTNGATGITLAIDGGTNAAKTTWSAAAVTAYDNLITKGWTITFNA